jgi:hypothetical protein
LSAKDTPEPGAQRSWQAACPNCGAPVAFRSAASAFAVCGFCRSTVVREGDALRRTGESAELFDDHSPLQLGSGGRYQGAGFSLIGRVQWRYADGTWNEWHALFDSGKSGWLSEDNGRYVLSFEAPAPTDAPPLGQLIAGAPITLGGQRWSVASLQAAQIQALQGELPQAPKAGSGWMVADLRNTRDEVATLEGPVRASAGTDAQALRMSIGRSVSLSDLAMSGLAGDSEKAMKGRSLECPSCGAALEVKLSTTQSIACHQCHAVVDVSQPGGVGGALKHYAQENGDEPLIPLGRVGTLNLLGKGPKPWQAVGYVERCEPPAVGEDEEDDGQSFWREYLLYNRIEGFAFLVDSEDGWSWTAPITGVPEATSNGVRYQGDLYRKLYSYGGKITYVLGEFYWKLEKGQTTANTDYAGSGKASQRRLNREQTGRGANAEVVWSCGEALDADAVRKAFRLPDESLARFRRDAAPTSLSGSSALQQLLVYGLIIAVVLILMRCGSRPKEDCQPYAQQFGQASAEYTQCLDRNRSSARGGGYGGGSWGGSGGGGHK